MTFTFENIGIRIDERKLVDDAFLSIRPGEIVGILGRNGAGKSSLLFALSGMKRAVSSLTVRSDGRNVDRNRLHRHVSFLPQEGFVSTHMKYSTCLKLLLDGRRIGRLIGDFPETEVFLKRRMHTLSGGERRFLELLPVLYSEKSLLLLDEPFGELDPLHEEAVLRMIRAAAEKSCVIVTEHRHRVLRNVCTKVFLLSDGNLRQCGNDEEMLKKAGYLPWDESVLSGDSGVSASGKSDARPFLTGNGTLSDLEIVPDRERSMSLLDYFDSTSSAESRSEIRELLMHPVSDASEIRARQYVYRYVIAHSQAFAATVEWFARNAQRLHQYGSIRYEPFGIAGRSPFDRLKAIAVSVRKREIFGGIREGVRCVSDLSGILSESADGLNDGGMPEKISRILRPLRPLFFETGQRDFGAAVLRSPGAILRADELLRSGSLLKNCTRALHELEAIMSVAKTIFVNGLRFPRFVESDHPVLKADGLYHPFLPEPVGNAFDSSGKTMFFITGPNMAGKSTFMKAVGILEFLAHSGIAVPAERAELSVFGGITTYMDVADDITSGHSYFYAEVLKIRETALFLKRTGKALVLLDEIFKGTNIHDACGCTEETIRLFMGRKDSLFIFASHLTELVLNLRKEDRIEFVCFEGEKTGDDIRFTYRLRPGISEQRMGLEILKRERLDEILGDETPARD